MVTALLLTVLLVFALALLVLALWQNDMFFGIAAGTTFLVTGLFTLVDGVDNFPTLFLTPVSLVFIIMGFGLGLIWAVGEGF